MDGSKNMACKSYAEMDALLSDAEKVEWLKTNGANICPNEADVPYRRHEITPNEITRVYSAAYSRTRSEIENLLRTFSHYDQWVTFEVDGNGNPTRVVAKPNWTTDPSCYSKPLFEEILRRHPQAREFNFMRARVSNADTIVIQLDSTETFFDFSNQPGFGGELITEPS